jgi:hypothetical protein
MHPDTMKKPTSAASSRDKAELNKRHGALATNGTDFIASGGF